MTEMRYKFKQVKKLKIDKNLGQVSFFMIFFIFLIIALFTGSSLFISSYLNFQERKINEVKALNIAESGVEYYRWFLNHFPTDYTDGTGRSGPYIHSFQDRLGNSLGEFALDVSPVASGTYVVKIRSAGKLYGSFPIEKNYKKLL